jgi:ATP-dependent DNA helicase RecQ
MLGIETPKVIRSIEYMRSIGILSKDNDMVAYLRNKRINELGYFARLEIALLNYIKENGIDLDLKIFNESAINQGIKKSKIKDIKTLLFFWQIENYCSKILRREDNEKVRLQLTEEIDKLRKRVEQRIDVCRCIISEMEKNKIISTNSETATVHFSMTSLLENINSAGLIYQDKISIDDLQEALLFLSKTGIISIEGGFMVIYNKLEIERVAENNLKYKKEDYKHLDTFYQQRIQQIHIVGEFANMVVKDYDKAMEFVKDYFHLDFKVFIKKYFDKLLHRHFLIPI